MKLRRDQLYVPTGVFNFVAQRDATVVRRYWVFRPPTEPWRNLGVGLAVKLPTGRYNLTGAAKDRNANPIIATPDQTLQPGDGRTAHSVAKRFSR